MWWTLAIWILLPGAEGWEFTVRGACRFEPARDGAVIVDAADGRPLAGLVVEVGEGARTLTSDARGQVSLSGRGWIVLRHRGSELHHPCWALLPSPAGSTAAGRFSWRWMGPVAGLVLILVALLPMARAGWRRRGKKREVPPPEEAPELEFAPPASRTFVPWRRPGFHGQVQVWESGLPLAGVVVSWLEHGAAGRAETDDDGRFFLPAAAVEVRFEKAGFHVVSLGRPRGQILVRLMSLPVRALWLLRQVCRRYDRERYAKLSPRQALAARIPPPERIERLEKLAYAGEAPAPGELEALERELAPDPESVSAAGT